MPPRRKTPHQQDVVQAAACRDHAREMVWRALCCLRCAAEHLEMAMEHDDSALTQDRALVVELAGIQDTLAGIRARQEA